MKTMEQRLMEALNKKAVMFGLPKKPIVVPESEIEALEDPESLEKKCENRK